MSQDLRALIEELASRADDFLGGGRTREEARAGIAEELTLEYPGLDSAVRAEVIAGVVQLLEEDDYFGIEFVGDPFAADDDNEEE